MQLFNGAQGNGLQASGAFMTCVFLAQTIDCILVPCMGRGGAEHVRHAVQRSFQVKQLM